MAPSIQLPMTRSLIPQAVRDRLSTLNPGGLALAAEESLVWLIVRTTAPEHLGAQPIDLRSELSCYDTGAVLELQLWLSGVLVQPTVFETWLDPANPDDRHALTLLSTAEDVEVLFFPQSQETLRFSKIFPIALTARQRLASLLTAGRAHADHLANPFWLAAKSEHLKKRLRDT